MRLQAAGSFLPIRDAKGVVAVEFALVAMVLLAVMLGAMDVGRLLWIQHHLTARSSDALRYASLRGAESGHPATENSQVTVDARYIYDSILAPIMPLEGIVLRSTQTTVVIN